MDQTNSDEKIKFEADKIYYDESTQRGINLSYSFYVTLGIFITIIGGFLSFNGVLGNYVNFIGLIFLFLLLPLAKISRLQADNGDLHKQFREKHKSNILFKGTGIKGVGDFFHYCVLVSITSFFLVKPFKGVVPAQAFSGLLLLVFIALMFVVYYVFARGDFLFDEIRYSKDENMQNIFLVILAIISIAYGFYFIVNL